MRNPRILFWFIVVLTIAAILIDLPNEKINFFIGNFHIQKDFSFQKGLDLQGGVSITYRANVSDIPSDLRKDALDSAKTVIEKRINFFGVAEPIIQTATVNNDARIIVEIPGIADVASAVNLIGTTAQLSFWEEGAASNAASLKPASQVNQKIASSSAFPLGLDLYLGPNPKKTDLTGKDLQKAGVTFDSTTGAPQVSLVFSDAGGKKFAEITKRNVNKRVAIVLDNQIVSAPNVNVPILTGNAVITGGFTIDQAKAISIQLNAGALPLPLSILEQRTIGPTLGESSLKKSLFAGTLGFLVVIIFMAVLYGRLGLLASGALVLYTLFVLALFKFIPITLTLAGIAGFVLSIGMAVDANILIFERMKEELRSKKSLPLAIELGFTRAWTSIRDSNIASLITAAILYEFGTNVVKNFAVTLAIGVLVSMFSAIVVTRTFLRILYRH